MDASQPSSPAPRTLTRRWLLVALILVATGAGFRAWLLFRTAIPAGVDAGYYPYQSRTLLELGRLAYDDVPLRFALDALVATVARTFTGWSIDDATLWASRVVDAISQPLTALVVVASCARWSRGRAGATAIASAVLAAGIACFPRPILDMVGDFEKQSLALTLTALTWWVSSLACRAERRSGQLAWAATAAVCLCMTAATHVGTFAVAVVGCVSMVTTWAILHGARARSFALGGAALFLVAALAWAGMWSVAPQKASALLTTPLGWLTGEASAEPGPGSGGVDLRTTFVFGAVVIVLSGIGYAALRRARAESRSPEADAALAIAMLAVLVVVTCPLIRGEYQMRVGLTAFTPIAFLVAFFLTCRDPARTTTRAGLVFQWMVISVAFAATAASAGGARSLHLRPSISEAGLADLRQWADELDTDFRTIVVARHGLEWWAGFAMRSAVRLGQAKPSDFERYERVLILKERSTRDPMEPDDGPPARGGRRGPPPPGGRGGPGGPMQLGPIPADAVLLRESPRFSLYEVKAPSVRS